MIVTFAIFQIYITRQYDLDDPFLIFDFRFLITSAFMLHLSLSCLYDRSWAHFSPIEWTWIFYAERYGNVAFKRSLRRGCVLGLLEYVASLLLRLRIQRLRGHFTL